MTDNRNSINQQNENAGQNADNKGLNEQTMNENKPHDRLKDGTNDFVNGDQEENSESSTDVDTTGQNR